jgi:dihydrofolate reductase
MNDFFTNIGAAAMGSSTYEWLLEEHKKQESERTWPYDIPIWVFSSRNLPPLEGADIRFAEGDVSAYHNEMKKAANGRNIWIIGGGELVGQFYDQGLLDEIILSVAPVMLKTGAKLLPRTIANPALKLTDIQKQENGFILSIYEVLKKD